MVIFNSYVKLPEGKGFLCLFTFLGDEILYINGGNDGFRMVLHVDLETHYQSLSIWGAFSRVEWALRVNMISADQRIRAPISFLHLTRRNPFSIVDVEGIDLRKNVQWKPWFYPAIDQGIL